MKEIFNFAIITIIGIITALCVISYEPVYAESAYGYETVSYVITDGVCTEVVDDGQAESEINTSKVDRDSSSEYLTSISSVGNKLRKEMVNRKESVTIKYKMKSSIMSSSEWFSDLCDDIFEYAFLHTGTPDEGDSLKFNVSDYNVKTTYYKIDGYSYMTLKFEISYYTTSKQESTLDSHVSKFKNNHKLSGESDYTIVKTIYDYICDNVKYSSRNGALKYTAYNALVNESAVCQGYAVLFYRLALEYGIDSRVISGTGKNTSHAWNIVKLDGKYYNLDSTWDAGNSSPKYFLKGSNSFDNHTSDKAYKTDSFKSRYPISKYQYPCSSHKWESSYTVDKKATYAASGSKSIHCSVCDVKKTSSITAIPKLVCKLSAPKTIKTALTSYYSSTSGYDDIKITWSKVSNASGYYVKYRKSGSDKWYGKYVSKTYTYLKDMSDGVKYEIYVYPYVKENGVKYKSCNYKKTTSIYTLKKIMINGILKKTGSNISLEYNDISGESGYQIYRASSKDGTYKKIKSVKSSDEKKYSVKIPAEKGKTYWYKIRPYKSIGDDKYVYGPWSDKIKYKR